MDLPPVLPAAAFSLFQPIEAPAQLPLVPEDGPLACVIDSGVVSAHPLLAGTVVDERDFDSGDGTAADLAGHGTHVAGIVVYGDIAACIRAGRWEPRVRLLSAKVLRRSPEGIAIFPDDSELRVETQIRDAINYYNQEFGCRVFNLSLGHYNRTYREGRQLPWALLLDELARDLDIVLVVAAGNVVSPNIPSPTTSEEFQREVRERLFSPEHSLTDPACALNALTVGAIARTDLSFEAQRHADRRPPLVASPALAPSPFTRAGVIESGVGGVGRAVKPELVAYGGNYCLGTGGQTWHTSDAHLGETVSSARLQGASRLVRVGTGTSVATPYITHVCARIEHQLRAAGRVERPTANLIRALAVHSARVPESAALWVRRGQLFGEEAECAAVSRLLGFGLPDPDRAMFSSDQRAVLIAEDQVEEGQFHVYELVLPPEYFQLTSRRRIRVTLAYDPPVRGTRRDYLGRRMSFRLVRDSGLEEIRRAAASGRDPEQVGVRPSADHVRRSTVQSATFTGTKPSVFDRRSDADDPVLWHVVVRCEARFAAVPETAQRYALVVSLEHDDVNVRIYQPVRQRVEQRQRVQWPGA